MPLNDKMKKHYLSILILFVAVALPLFAGEPETLSKQLYSLRYELQRDYRQMSVTKVKMTNKYEEQHQKMVDIIRQCNALSLRLYSQKQEYTLDLCFALERVRDEYVDFNKDRTPYDRIVSNLDIEIDRYARLIEALRRLPPERTYIRNLPDSLAYHNDTLNLHLRLNSDNRIDLAEEAKDLDRNEALVFVLDKEGERNRDTCLYYATELLKMYAESREIVVSDSVHYQETYLRLKESYDYACNYYKLLQTRVFVEGQTPWPVILSSPKYFWSEAVEDMKNKYDLFSKIDSDTLSEVGPPPFLDTLPSHMLTMDTMQHGDTLNVSAAATGTLVDSSMKPTDKDDLFDSSWDHSYVLLYVFAVMVVGLLLCFLLAWVVLFPVFRFVKPLRNSVSKEQRRGIILLAAILLFVLFGGNSKSTDMLEKALKLANTFMWLLAAIVAALLIRLDPTQLKNSARLYMPTIFLAILVIGCRAIFMPNSMMNFIFPPVLLLFFLWQLLAFFKHGKKAQKSDRIIGRISFIVTGVALLASVAGYIFVSLLLLIWWYFQMAVIHTMTTIRYLIMLYKTKRVERRIDEYRERITFVGGSDKEELLFGATWLYDLIREVVLPVIALMSIPFCVHLALDVFDFDDLYKNMYYNPFYQYVNSDGTVSFRISFYAIMLLVCLVFVFRYVSRALHVIWHQSRYMVFMRKNHRKNIRKNEINLSLGDSLISVLVWVIYSIIVIVTFHIPTGSLGLVLGGFSAGVGLALKDVINNFIYSIQLMTGRLKTGDWIECDGVRGCVTSISYQSTQVETIDGTTVSFLNSDLFSKNFTNLTKSNSYELLKLFVSVAYGTDMQRVREILVDAMQVMRTKDSYGREVVEPKKGIYVAINEFGDNGVNVVVKQYVLVVDRIAYIDRAKEVIYNALNDNGIVIPFPQRDIHVVN